MTPIVLPADSFMSVRERPLLRLASTITNPDGQVARWAPDEHLAQNTLEGLAFSSTMPGGFEQASGMLERNPARDYPDLAEFSTWTIYGLGGEIAWQGRLETTPRASGDQIAVTPGAVGWQAALTDLSDVREIFVDRDFSVWSGASVTRQLALVSLAAGYQVSGPSGAPDWTTGQPALKMSITDAPTWGEAIYDARGIPVAKLYAAWKCSPNLVGATAAQGWDFHTGLSSGDDITSYDTNILTPFTATGSATVTATTTARKFGFLQFAFTSPTGFTGSMGGELVEFFTCLAIYGAHGLTLQGSNSQTGAQGVFASDVVAYILSTWVPELAFATSGGAQTIQPTRFIIPHLTFTDPTTAAEMIKQASRFDLEDWAVWDGPTFWYAPRGFYGNSWQARVGPSGLQETGPQVDRLWNSVVVQYTDVMGTTRTVGPIGTNSDTTDVSLTDADPANPVTAAGLTRRALLSMGTSTAAGAIKIGQTFLQYQKALSTAGQAAIVGHVQDTSGVLWPAWRIRAGDTITFTDAHDPSPRRVVRASYDDNTKTCTVDLDSPPDAMAALLERMQISIKRLGF